MACTGQAGEREGGGVGEGGGQPGSDGMFNVEAGERGKGEGFGNWGLVLVGSSVCGV